jgi:hypothetical protein
MGYSSPILTVYVPKRAGREFLVQRYMEHPTFGYSQATGDVISLDEASMLRDGGILVARLLGEYSTQVDLGKSSIDSMPADVRRRFAHEYWEVIVSLQPSGYLKIYLIDVDDAGDSGSGRDDHAVLLAQPATGTQLLAALKTVVPGKGKGDIP